MRQIAMLIVCALATLVSATGVAAAAPEKERFDNGYNSFVDTEVCADAPWQFDVNATEHEYGFYQVFFDASGEVTKVMVHFNYDATISANGITIVERDTWTAIFTADGSRDVGLTVHIQGPGGMVQLDAGQVVFDADGNFLYVRGPHVQFLGERFCPALVA